MLHLKEHQIRSYLCRLHLGKGGGTIYIKE